MDGKPLLGWIATGLFGLFAFFAHSYTSALQAAIDKGMDEARQAKIHVQSVDQKTYQNMMDIKLLSKDIQSLSSKLSQVIDSVENYIEVSTQSNSDFSKQMSDIRNAIYRLELTNSQTIIVENREDFKYGRKKTEKNKSR